MTVNNDPETQPTIRLKPGHVYRAGDDARYLSGVCSDGNAATFTWANTAFGSPWQQCDAAEFRAWVQNNNAVEEACVI